MTIENIKVEDIKLYEKNARKHPKKQIDLLIKNIKRFGFTTPLLIDKNNELIAGHGRIMAGNQIGMIEYPCVRLENLTADEVKALRLADNQIASLAEWDLDLALPELKGLDIELQGLTGFDKELLIEPEERDDEVPETPAEPRTVLGDIYELGNHRVMCGDSTMIDQVEKLMNGEKADMVFTDPPYGIAYQSNAWDSKQGEVKKKRTDTKIIDDEDTNIAKQVIGILPMVTQRDTHFYIWCRWDVFADFKVSCQAIGAVKSVIVWDKGGPGLGDLKGSYGDNEWSIFGMIGRRELKERQNSVWQVNRMKGLQMSHPTQKPLELCERAILNSSDANEIVIDLFLGSGSTLIACEKTNRRCYGVEIDPHYVDVCVERWCQYTGNTKIKLNGQEITWDKTEA